MNTKKLVSLIKDPAKEISNLTGLVYVNDEELTISRHRKGKGFYYTRNGKKIENKSLLKRINSLVLPPAWNNVKITHIKNGHLQAVGLDTKKRKVYKYHEEWSQFRSQTKFLKLAVFGKKLPKIRKQIEKDLRTHKMTEKKVLALVIRLMEETHIRIGNSYYAKENKSYGLSTLRSKHLISKPNEITFRFVGKKGIKNEVSLKDKRLIRLINQCEEIPGWELFKYYDEDGSVQTISSTMVNTYLHDISGELFSAKDFRTWSATKIFMETLHQLGHTESESEIKKNKIQAMDTSAKALGNTRSVCENYYVHPSVVESYENGKIKNYFKKMEENRIKDDLYFSKNEKILLTLLNNYTSTIEDNN